MENQNKSWQSRLSKQQDNIAIDFVESISIDKRLYKYDIQGSIAHAQMLCDQNLITNDELNLIENGLLQISTEIQNGQFTFDKKFEDIHMVIEAALIAKIGDAGKKLHTGRSRNDQVALDLRLWARETIDNINKNIINLKKSFISLASSDQGQCVISGYTHLQRAQPILAGNYLLAFVEKFHRDQLRFDNCRERLNSNPLGCGAIAGTSLPIDRAKTAQLLDFPDNTRNSIDTISDRDFCIELIFCCSMVATHLSRLAEDWITYSSQEFDIITIDDAYCTSSSMMPQKRNPDMLELIRGKTGQLYGNLNAMLTIMKGLPLTYNRDMQEDKKQLFDATDTTLACLNMATAIVNNTAFNTKTIEAKLDTGYLDATALAEYLVNKNIPFRTAHQIVGEIVRICESDNIPLSDLPIEKYQNISNAIDKDVYQFINPINVVKNYKSLAAGGADQLNEQLSFWYNSLNTTPD